MLRHGEPLGGRKYRGQLDDPLSDTGWAEVRAALGDACLWDAIVSSPLQRCVAFAREVAARCRLPLVEDARLMEIGFGDWEGRTAEELLAEDRNLLMRFWSDPVAHRPPGAEPLADFEARVLAAWEDLLAEYRGRHVLVVGHAGIIRMVIRHVLDMPLSALFRIEVPTGGLSRIRVDDDGQRRLPRLTFHAGGL